MDQQAVFTCQQAGTTQWTISLPGGVSFSSPAQSSQAGVTFNIQNNLGYMFEIHVLPSSSSSSVISELRVTAVRQLNGVTVECLGSSGRFMSTVQIALDPG